MQERQKAMLGTMIPAMVTPFDDNLEVDIPQGVALAKRLVEGGADGLVIFGTTGEGPTVDLMDKISLIEAVVQELSGQVPIVANIGTYNTQASIDFAIQAASVGVDGLMAVVPYYNKPPQEGLYQHFRAIAQATELPLIMYNIPSRCAINMEADTILRLARDCDNIVAVKEASGDMDQVAKIASEAPEGFSVYAGDDAICVDVMERGGAGVISTIGNVTPAAMKHIVDLCVAGNWDEARAASDALEPLMKELFTTTNPILVKKAITLQGFDVGGLRLPLINATPEQTEHLAQVMREVGALD